MKRRVTGIDVRTESETSGREFLRLETMTCRSRYEDGSLSDPWRAQLVHRRGWDSVAVVPWWFEPGEPQRLHVVVALGIRPAPWVRAQRDVPVPETGNGLYEIESIAGSLEPGDVGEEGIDRRAAAELLEETGFLVPVEAIERLGGGILPSHGQATEMVHFRAARVDPQRRREPSGDGSVTERDALLETYEAGELLRLCERGVCRDPKVEISVQRLARRLGVAL